MKKGHSEMIKVKENDENKQMLETYLNAILEQCNILNIPIGKDIIIMTDYRSSRNLGRCTKLSYYKIKDTELEDYDYQIKISKFVFKEDRNLLKNTLAHELLHTCENCMNHGNQWKYFAAKMNKNYDYDIKILYNSGTTKRAKYIIECTSCGNKATRYKDCKAIQNLHRCSCGKCGSKELKLIKN